MPHPAPPRHKSACGGYEACGGARAGRLRCSLWRRRARGLLRRSRRQGPPAGRLLLLHRRPRVCVDSKRAHESAGQRACGKSMRVTAFPPLRRVVAGRLRAGRGVARVPTLSKCGSAGPQFGGREREARRSAVRVRGRAALVGARASKGGVDAGMRRARERGRMCTRVCTRMCTAGSSHVHRSCACAPLSTLVDRRSSAACCACASVCAGTLVRVACDRFELLETRAVLGALETTSLIRLLVWPSLSAVTPLVGLVGRDGPLTHTLHHGRCNYHLSTESQR